MVALIWKAKLECCSIRTLEQISFHIGTRVKWPLQVEGVAGVGKLLLGAARRYHQGQFRWWRLPTRGFRRSSTGPKVALLRSYQQQQCCRIQYIFPYITLNCPRVPYTRLCRTAWPFVQNVARTLPPGSRLDCRMPPGFSRSYRSPSGTFSLRL